MKVGTDGVLLGAWCELNNAKTVLDIGSGTGLIALMLAQKSVCEVDIVALEIDEKASEQSMCNVSNANRSNCISVVNLSLQRYEEDYNGDGYDLIVSNPPFFENSLKNPTADRARARQIGRASCRERESSPV